MLRSWAVPKGPSTDPSEKRLAVQVPDHSLSHGDYEGPKRDHLGRRRVRAARRERLDGRRRWTPATRRSGSRARSCAAAGRCTARGGEKPQWLLIKRRDEEADEGDAVRGSRSRSRRGGRCDAPRRRPRGAMKAVLTDERFSDPDWIFERKLDGIRCVAIRDGGAVQDALAQRPVVERPLSGDRRRRWTRRSGRGSPSTARSSPSTARSPASSRARRGSITSSTCCGWTARTCATGRCASARRCCATRWRGTTRSG